MRDERGFTLLEVVVALTIAGLGLAALLAAASTGLASVDQSARYSIALRHAESRMAQLGIAQPLRAGVQQGEEADGSLWRIETRRVMTHGPLQDGGRNQPGRTLYAVAVVITWTWAGHTRSLQLDTYRLGPAAAGSG
jgi:type II secretion system protein I